MYKKAQIKFGETIGILFIVYLMIVGGLIWYNNSNSKSVNKLYNDDQFDRAFEKYYYITSLDLIHKSNRGVIDNIYDLDSLIVFANYSITEEGKEFLRSQLGESKIIIYLFEAEDITSIENNLPYNEIVIYENNVNEELYEIKEEIRFKTLIPVINSSDVVSIGILEVISYIK